MLLLGPAVWEGRPGAAGRVLLPLLLVQAGIYREWVKPRRGDAVGDHRDPPRINSHRCGALGQPLDVAHEPGKEDREGGAGHGRGGVRHHLQYGLGIADHDIRFYADLTEEIRIFLFFNS